MKRFKSFETPYLRSVISDPPLRLDAVTLARRKRRVQSPVSLGSQGWRTKWVIIVGTVCRGHKEAHSNGSSWKSVKVSRRLGGYAASAHSFDVHLFPTKNGPGPGHPKYSDRESGTLTSRRIVRDHDHRAFSFLFFLSSRVPPMLSI